MLKLFSSINSVNIEMTEPNNNEVSAAGLSQVISLASKHLRAEEDRPKTKPLSRCTRLLPFIPLGVPILIISVSIIIYVQAVVYDHVEPIFPYVSDAGTTPPEAAYFSFSLIVLSFLGVITAVIRFRQVKSICRNPNSNLLDERKEKVLELAKFNFVVTLLMSLGVAGVASFRVTETLWHHIVSATFFFGPVPFLAFMETKVSFMTSPIGTRRWLAQLRLVLFVILVISVICAGVSAACSFLLANDLDKMMGIERLKWMPKDGGYVMHVFSSAMEWVVIYVSSGFYATYYVDFKRCSIVDRDIHFKLYK